MPSTAAEAAEIVVIMQMPCLTASVRIWFSFWRGTVPCGVLMMRETLLFLIRSITLGRPSLRRQTFFYIDTVFFKNFASASSGQYAEAELTELAGDVDRAIFVAVFHADKHIARIRKCGLGGHLRFGEGHA